MTEEQKSALVDALKALPTRALFIAGMGIRLAENDDAPEVERMPGVLIRWDDTPEGRTAAGLFAKALWA